MRSRPTRTRTRIGASANAGILRPRAPFLPANGPSRAVSAHYCSFGPFWALSSSFLRGTAAAAGIAVINSCGNLGGFVSPTAVGFIKKQTGSFRGGILLVAGVLLAASLLIAVGTRRAERR